MASVIMRLSPFGLLHGKSTSICLDHGLLKHGNSALQRNAAISHRACIGTPPCNATIPKRKPHSVPKK